MKKILILIYLGLILTSHSQTLDKFYIYKGDTIKQSSWTILHKESDLFVLIRAYKVNSNPFFEVKFHIGNYGAFVVSDTNHIWLKTSDGKTVVFKNPSTITAKRGGAAYELTGLTVHGVDIKYPMTKDQGVSFETTLFSKKSPLI